MRYGVVYPFCVMEKHERLKMAREKAGYSSAKEAALSIGMAVSTYLGHENGSRGITRDRAAVYARKFKVSPEWLIWGRGAGPGADGPDALSNIVHNLDPERMRILLDIAKGLAGRE